MRLRWESWQEKMERESQWHKHFAIYVPIPGGLAILQTVERRVKYWHGEHVEYEYRELGKAECKDVAC